MQLTIITINLNNLNGLRKTLDSVSTQIFTDFEIIIVDGASNDGSLDLIYDFRKSTTLDFTMISEPDSGVFQAMNKGINVAKGEYLLFLNSGDFLVSDSVLNEVFSKKHTADFLLARCNISENGIVIHTTQPASKITFGFIFNNGIAHQSTFIKRELFNLYGNYREDFRYNSDIEFWYRTIILAYRSTESLGTIVSDYNTDGISSMDCNTLAYLSEINEIYSHPLLQLFIPDYELWILEMKEMESLFWVKNKKILYLILDSIFKFSKWLFKNFR